MEEEGGAKAPVTRLRRRLSVELSEDSKSPSAPATPTKKRGGRLAAKPQLELIDENVPQNSPKRATRKSIIHDAIEPVEEKAITPSRRSTRIKSNSSIVSDTIQAVDSPRAKRAAARRNSQVGSDGENTLTPARTKRTRKESTSSVDKQLESGINGTETNGKNKTTRKNSTSNTDKQETDQTNKPALITETISEEPENNLRKSTEDKYDTDSPNNTRKSPRLQAKKDKSSRSESETSDHHNAQNSNSIVANNKYINSSIILESTDSNRLISNHNDSIFMKSDSNKLEKLSHSHSELIENLEKNPEQSSNLNKSTSAIEHLKLSEIKRHRTKSWTTLSTSFPNEGNFYSDNESTKKKLKKNAKVFSAKVSKPAGSGDNGPNSSNSKYDEVNITDVSSNLSLKKKKHPDASFSTEPLSSSLLATPPQRLDVLQVTANQDAGNKDDSKTGKRKSSKNQDSLIDFIFQETPTSGIQSMIFVEDSDSNTDSLGKPIHDKQYEGEDQCVPVVDSVLKKQESSKMDNVDINTINNQSEDPKVGEKITNNDSCEPMDIDETMPENLLPNDFCKDSDADNNSTKMKNKSSRKSSLSIFQGVEEEPNQIFSTSRNRSSLSQSEIENESSKMKDKLPLIQNDDYCETNKSKRKSSLSQTTLQDLEKSNSENKSTLVLSQIKDISASDQNESKCANDHLSNSLNIPDSIKDGITNKTLSHNYLTSTPVQQKETLDVKMNTSAITPKAHNTVHKKVDEEIKNEDSITSKSNLESSDESSDDNSTGLFIKEAGDAGNDYESGDSQDDDERQYEKENEILEKGVTLSSEEEMSDDSDYEKDSFVVSSNEEDDELLSGSGDDLGLSDNELSMSAKSKKKYNERSEKQQKKLSREMYESRHKLDKSDNSTKETFKKYNRMRLDSTVLDTGDDTMLPPKKNKRMRLDSSRDWSVTDANEVGTLQADNMTVPSTEKLERKKKKTKRLSESISNESTTNNNDVDISKQKLNLDTSEIGYKKKKKSKRLSESDCVDEELKESEMTDSIIPEIEADNMQLSHNESSMNEKEITMCDEIPVEDDPLSVLVKQETKTPMKSLDISTIHITHRAEIEQVHIDENFSISKENVPIDPLQSTIGKDDSDVEEYGSISENEEITSNYESVLNKLNKENSSKNIKSFDISLDMNRKIKPKTQTTIFEQLNITQTKDLKPKKKTKLIETNSQKLKQGNRSTVKEIVNTSDDETENLDLRLLFSDDSNDSTKNCDNKMIEITELEEFIPLKKTDAKTNIRGSLNALEAKTSTKKKTKKRESSQTDVDIKTSDNEDGTNFFMDTVGTRFELEASNNVNDSLKSTSTFNKCKDLSIVTKDQKLKFDDAPDELSYHSKKNKSGRLSQSKAVQVETTKTPANVSINNTSQSEKNKRKISELHNTDNSANNKHETDTVENLENTKKRKRKSSTNQFAEGAVADDLTDNTNVSKISNTPLPSNQKKKRKITVNDEHTAKQNEAIDIQTHSKNVETKLYKKKDDVTRSKKSKLDETLDFKLTSNIGNATKSVNKYVNKKRKRDDDDGVKKSKIRKESSLDNIHVARLPASVLNQLEDKPRKEVLEMKKSKIISTTDFLVEETKKRKNKPSNFLEESIYLNGPETIHAKKLANMKKPKVLPFIPTASTSISGFTSNFQVKVVPQKMEFVAQSSHITNFKNDYLNNKRIKKMRTYELYKNHRNVKLSKF